MTIGYSSAGTGLWTNSYTGQGAWWQRGGCGGGWEWRVYVTGNAYANGGAPEVATLAYSTAGTALWTNHYLGGATCRPKLWRQVVTETCL